MSHRRWVTGLALLVAGAASAQLAKEFPISNGMWLERQPSISFNWVVWADDRDAGKTGIDIWGLNLLTDRPTPICQDTYNQVHPCANFWRNQLLCVWEDYRTKNSPDVWGVLDVGGKPFAMTGFPGAETLPKCWGKNVVYENAELPAPPTGADIWGYNLGTGANLPLVTAFGDQVSPHIDGYTVVWADDRPSVLDNRWDIYALDIRTMEETHLTNSLQFDQHPAVSGDWVVYQTQNWTGEWDIMAKRISDPLAPAIPVCVEKGNQTNPAIWGNVIVWEDGRAGTPSIYAYDLACGKEFPVSAPVFPKYDAEPDVSQNVVVWSRYMDIGPLYEADVYGGWLSASTISGVVELGDFVGDIQSVPMELELVPADPPGRTALPIRLNADGSFIACTLLQGLYYVALKPSHWLRQRFPQAVQLAYGQTTSVKFSLTNGDAWPDNTVGIGDLSQVLAYFDQLSPEHGDLNCDWQVGISDLSVVLSNFGLHGDG